VAAAAAAAEAGPEEATTGATTTNYRCCSSREKRRSGTAGRPASTLKAVHDELKAPRVTMTARDNDGA
jgi:hypothetical protein